MDTNIAHKIARAFVHGLAFAKGMTTLAQDAKAKMDEGDKWATIGAEPGDGGKKHGGRHVLISGTGEVKAGLSKSAQGKPLGEAIKELKDKAESKEAENKKANLSPEDRQTLRKLKTDNTKALKGLDNLKSSLSAENIARRKYHLSKPDAEIVQDTRQKIDQLKPLSAKLIKQVTANVADGRYSIDAAQEILASANQTIRQIRNIGSHMYAASMHGYGGPNAMEEDYRLIRGLYTQLDKAAQQVAENKKAESKKAEGKTSKAPSAAGLLQEKGSALAQLTEREQTESAPETHTYSAKELDSMKQKQEGRAKAKKQNAELNRKFKEGVESGNIRFPRNEFRERAKAYTEQANQVINDDLKPSVDKLGSTIRKNTDNARMPQSTLDDLNDIHNLAKQIGPMASKLNKYNEKYAAEHDDPSNYAISNYGAATKGTAETVASLARRAAAMSNQLTAPDDERDYSEGRAKQEIRDILTEMRGLHGDLLKKTRHAATAFKTEKPSSSESDRVDAMYAQKGSKPKQRIIN